MAALQSLKEGEYCKLRRFNLIPNKKDVVGANPLGCLLYDSCHKIVEAATIIIQQLRLTTFTKMTRQTTSLLFLVLSLLRVSSFSVDGFSPFSRSFGVRQKLFGRIEPLYVTPPKNIVPQHKPIPHKHLFRHYDDISMDCWLRCAEPEQFLLSCGYTRKDIDKMAGEWPALLEKDVHDHVAPHVRFLVKTLQGGTGDLLWASEEDALVKHEDEECPPPEADIPKHQLIVSELAKHAVPVQFFNMRLEKPVAPHHAYLVWQDLPSGEALLAENGKKLMEFLDTCKTSKLDKFIDLCNRWDTSGKVHTAYDIAEFEYAFQEGLVPAARNHLHTGTKCEPGRMVDLLLTHGANHLEDDHHGASLVHWAAGTGNLEGLNALLRASQEDGYSLDEAIITDHVAKDGATPLHWSACGVTSQGVFGTGGHKEVCRFLLDQAGKDLVNEENYSHSTPLEWAAWGGALDVVKMMIEEYGADPHFVSDGNVAHWACAGGSLPVCQYLAEKGVDFLMTNESMGWTPLALAEYAGHRDVVDWLVQNFYSGEPGLAAVDEIMKEVAVAIEKESKKAAGSTV